MADAVVERLPGSFRDPSGFVFRQDGIYYRRIQPQYLDDYRALRSLGLYERLTAERLLVPHEELAGGPDGGLTIRPEQIPFITYAYEWCFSQLRDAALLTLQVQEQALAHDMVLKDATPFNVQLLGGRPILIDTLSFERLVPGAPWTAYRQFCEMFLAPLALMACRDVTLGRLLAIHLDGIPLETACRLLPLRSRFSVHRFIHLFAHARSQRLASRLEGPPKRRVSRHGLVALVDSLRSAVESLTWRPRRHEWLDYYATCSYDDEAQRAKMAATAEALTELSPAVVWDFGANTGRYARLATERSIMAVAMDCDAGCVESMYRDARSRGDTHLVPLVIDLRNPTPALGWRNRERMSLSERGPADLGLAMALVHHLAIAGNIPLDEIVGFLHRHARAVLVEWVPKEDRMVQRLLRTRTDIFPDYERARFETLLSSLFVIERTILIPGSHRVMYRAVRRVNT